MNRAIRNRADLDGSPDVVAFDDDPGCRAPAHHLIGLLRFLTVSGGLDLDILALRDDRLIALRSVPLGNLDQSGILLRLLFQPRRNLSFITSGIKAAIIVLKASNKAVLDPVRFSQ